MEVKLKLWRMTRLAKEARERREARKALKEKLKDTGKVLAAALMAAVYIYIPLKMFIL